MWEGINRRRFPRARFKTTVYVKKKDTATKITAYTENIGSGGLCIITNDNPGLFQGVSIELDLQNGIPSTIKCSGTVVWVVKKHPAKQREGVSYDIGIEFVDIEERDRVRMEKKVDHFLKK